MYRAITLTLLLGLLAQPALSAPSASTSPSRAYVENHRAPGARKHVFRGRKMVELPTHERANIEAYQQRLAHTVGLIYNPYPSTGHELLRIGNVFGDLGYTRQANKRSLPKWARQKSGIVEFVFDVTRPEALPAVQAEMQKELESLARYNVPVFSTYSRRTRLRPAGEGRFEILPPARPESFGEANGIVQAELVREGGKVFLRSPNGVTTPAKQVGDLIEVEARSCISWPTDLLSRHAEALGLRPMALRKDTRRMTTELMRSERPFAMPDLVTVYTSTPGQFDMETFAQKIGGENDRNLAGPANTTPIVPGAFVPLRPRGAGR